MPIQPVHKDQSTWPPPPPCVNCSPKGLVHSPITDKSLQSDRSSNPHKTKPTANKTSTIQWPMTWSILSSVSSSAHLFRPLIDGIVKNRLWLSRLLNRNANVHDFLSHPFFGVAYRDHPVNISFLRSDNNGWHIWRLLNFSNRATPSSFRSG